MRKATIFTGLANLDKNLVGTAIIYKKIADLLKEKKSVVKEKLIKFINDL